MIDKIGRAAFFAKSHFKTAVNSAKELKGKTIYKAKGLKKKAVAKHAKITKDYGIYKGSFVKDFAAETRREGRLLRKNVFTGKNALATAFNYPITTGVGIGITARALQPKKDKKKKKV
jgi:hypothetical protein